MKAVIDTNILMSGTFWGGPPAKVLNAYLKDKFEWIVSTEILEDFWRVLTVCSPLELQQSRLRHLD